MSESAQATPTAPAFERHLLGPDSSVLERIKDPGLSVVVWRRRLPLGLGGALQRWAAQLPPRFEARVGKGERWLDTALSGFEPCPARAFLAADLVELERRFRQITSAASIKLAFGTVRGDQCRKFHADYQRLRLITTYLGPGTEWLPEHAVRREALEDPPACPDEANQIIVRDAKPIQRARPGDVLLLRGHDGVCGEALGAVHRSPPVAASGTTRVVFVASV